MRPSLIPASVSCLLALAALAISVPPVEAYGKYSQSKRLVVGSWRCAPDAKDCSEPVGNCKTCHGNFRATDETDANPQLRDEYVSPVDGQPWRETYRQRKGEISEEVGLHRIHARIMLKSQVADASCPVCHSDGSDGKISYYPVLIGSASTNSVLLNEHDESIGCMGCHGRDGDDDGDENRLTGRGRAAGLLQHHTNAGVTECKACHEDADPARNMGIPLLPENIAPSYYSVVDKELPNKPTDPCNRFGEEDYAGHRTGLDNDGDGRYDRQDSDCRR